MKNINNTSSEILQTKRLKILIPNKDSLNNRYQLLSDPEVSKYLGDGEPKKEQYVKEFLQKNISHYQAHGFCLFDVFDRKTGEFIGDAGLIYEGLNSKNDNVEVGYRLLKKHWGKGYATELTDALIKWGFSKFNLPRIAAFCYPKNISSSNVMKKCGMKYAGKHFYSGETECDSYFVNNIIVTTVYSRAINPTKDAEITLSEYDSNWILKFEEEKKLLLNIIGQYFYGSVEHVGSTSVPGLIAKPVIDIMFGVKSLEDSKSAIKILTKNGYSYSPYKTEVMHWFCKPSSEFRTHHLHLIAFKSDLWKERIKFRDTLKKNPQITNQYILLKRELAEKHKGDREAYTKGKTSFIKKVLNDFS